jgi:hypothetical protein
MSVRRSRGSKLRSKIVTGCSGNALVEVSIRLRLDDGGHVTTGTVNIPRSVKTPERAFRTTVADQLHRLADQIATAHADNLLDPLAWPLVQFDPPACDEAAVRQPTLAPVRAVQLDQDGRLLTAATQ